MTTAYASFGHLSDRDLLREVTRLAAGERHATAQLIASLVAVDTRRLHLSEGFSSLFEYCTQSLRLSEHAAYDRITAARAARRFPVILDHLADGSVTLTTVRLLAPHLTDANHATLLAEARHRSKRDVEHIIVRLHPQPDVPASVRKLPAPTLPQQPATSATPTREPTEKRVASATPKLVSHPSGPFQVSPSVNPPSPPRPAVLAPIATARYRVSFTMGAETYAKLRQVQDLLRHAVPDGDPGVIYDRALTALVTPHPCGRPARGVATRRWPVHLRGSNRSAVLGPCVARVSPHGSLRPGRRGDGRQHAAVVPGSQPAAGDTRFWTAGRTARAGNRTSIWSQHASTRAGTSSQWAYAVSQASSRISSSERFKWSSL